MIHQTHALIINGRTIPVDNIIISSFDIKFKDKTVWVVKYGIPKITVSEYKEIGPGIPLKEPNFVRVISTGEQFIEMYDAKLNRM